MASLASYRRCCDQLIAAWRAFFAGLEARLAQQRFGVVAGKVLSPPIYQPKSVTQVSFVLIQVKGSAHSTRHKLTRRASRSGL